jgi:Uma2 family endonuclease
MKISADEFWKVYPFKPYELVDGRVQEVKHLDFRSSVIGLRVVTLLEQFVNENGLGEVFGALCPFGLSNYTVLMPEAAYITQQKWDSIRYPYRYLPFPPDLCVEVIPQRTRKQRTIERMHHYFRAGTKAIWLLYPDTQQVGVYTRTGQSNIYTTRGVINGDSALPGFELPVAKLFPKR